MTRGLFARICHTSMGPMRRPALIAVGVALVTFQLCGWLGLRFNLSPSLPMGIYIRGDETISNLVEFCPAEPFASMAIDRGYRDQGACPDGGAPLLKPVVAKAGDTVALSDRGITVNGVLYRNTAPLSNDTRRRPLAAWPNGRYIVFPGTIWVASSYNPRSFDSRYFGPVRINAIRNYVRPLLTGGK